jgi:hypothetical protein
VINLVYDFFCLYMEMNHDLVSLDKRIILAPELSYCVLIHC